MLCRDPFEDRAIVVRAATSFRPPILALYDIFPTFPSSSLEKIMPKEDRASDATSCNDFEEGECHHI